MPVNRVDDKIGRVNWPQPRTVSPAPGPSYKPGASSPAAAQKAQEIIGKTPYSAKNRPLSKGELVPFNIAIKDAAHSGNIDRMERIYANIISNGLAPIFLRIPR